MSVAFSVSLIESSLCMQTINDVLFGVISCGLSKYLDNQSPKGELSFHF